MNDFVFALRTSRSHRATPNGVSFGGCYGVIKAIKKYEESLHLKNPYSVPQSERKGRKATRNLPSQKPRPLRTGRDWPAVCSGLQNSASSTKLKWFQCSILYRILTTNHYLYKRKVIDSECRLRKTEKETIRHLLWDCTYNETFRKCF